MKPLIVVLEDTVERIEWLEDIFGNVAEVWWCEKVNDFLALMQEADRSRLALVVLDHDLGGVTVDPGVKGSPTNYDVSGTFPRDSDGMTGMDAVEALDPWKDVPVLVWSANMRMGPQMEEHLRREGFVTAWVPFDPETVWTIRGLVYGALDAEERKQDQEGVRVRPRPEGWPAEA